MTDAQRKLLKAYGAYEEARLAMQRCLADSIDSDYFCYERARDETKAGREFFDLMDAYIDARITAKV